jgi:outer membrane protein OmpA-like peptidoglycan-associated protein
VEKGAMKQEISSSDMREALERDGHVALDIHFDTGKATIKPDSQAIVAQIVKLLQEDAELSLKVEGHTDNVGDAKANLALSKARAKSVVAALTAQSIEAKRLQDDGFGMTKPVADNATAEGRAKNRRVELVKR